MDAKEKISIIRDAATVVTKSQSFQRFLLVVLEVGNYLNHGTLKGDAFGFNLNSLQLLESCKGYDSDKTSLLRFVLKQLQQEDPSCLAFINDFDLCKPASLIPITDLEATVKGFSSSLQELEEVLDVFEGQQELFLQTFKVKMRNFKEEARLQLDELIDFYKDMQRKLQTCSIVYAEDPFKAEDFFGFLKDFSRSCRDTLE